MEDNNKQMTNENQFETISDEVIVLIFCILDIETFYFDIGRVCKRFLQLSRDIFTVNSYFKMRFPLSPLPDPLSRTELMIIFKQITIMDRISCDELIWNSIESMEIPSRRRLYVDVSKLGVSLLFRTLFQHK
jgi:hypothetical protein